MSNRGSTTRRIAPVSRPTTCLTSPGRDETSGADDLVLRWSAKSSSVLVPRMYPRLRRRQAVLVPPARRAIEQLVGRAIRFHATGVGRVRVEYLSILEDERAHAGQVAGEVALERAEVVSRVWLPGNKRRSEVLAEVAVI